MPLPTPFLRRPPPRFHTLRCRNRGRLRFTIYHGAFTEMLQLDSWTATTAGQCCAARLLGAVIAASTPGKQGAHCIPRSNSHMAAGPAQHVRMPGCYGASAADRASTAPTVPLLPAGWRGG